MPKCMHVCLFVVRLVALARVHFIFWKTFTFVHQVPKHHTSARLVSQVVAGCKDVQSFLILCDNPQAAITRKARRQEAKRARGWQPQSLK